MADHDATGELAELRAVARDIARDPETGWRQWAELGRLSLLVAEERGGAGADERAAAVVARELGAAGRCSPRTTGPSPSTIYGGSSEIQRNIIAKQVLRLPGSQ